MIRTLSLRQTFSTCDRWGLVKHCFISHKTSTGNIAFSSTPVAMSAPDFNVMSKAQLEHRISELTELVARHKTPGDPTISKTMRKKQNKQAKEKARLEDMLAILLSPTEQVRISQDPLYQTTRDVATTHLSKRSFPPSQGTREHDAMFLTVKWPGSKDANAETGSAQESLDMENGIATSATANTGAQPIPNHFDPISELPIQLPPTESLKQGTGGPTATANRERNQAPFVPKKGERKRDAIVAPSMQSGGIPEPSAQYLAQSMAVSYNTGVLQPILLVIDLNGTILHRPSRATPTRFVERPYTSHFLHHAFGNFSIMVWSSARPENVANMCKRLFTSKQRHHLLAEWGRDRLGLSAADYSKRVQVYKRLQIVWSDAAVQSAHPLVAEGRYWDASNTILLDDSVEKARSEPFNLLSVPEFDGRAEDPDILRKVAEYLDVVKVQSNVAAFIRANPFRLDTVPAAPVAESTQQQQQQPLH